MPFQLNGQTFTRKQLSAFAEAQLQGDLPLWKRDLYSFILEWLNDDVFITVKTSGSTGAPKTIKLAKEKVRNSALMTAKYLGLGEGSSALLSLSAQYIAGKMMVVRAIENNWNLWTVEPSNYPLKDIDPNIMINLVAWVPSQLQAMLEMNDKKLNRRLQSISNIILGGSPVQPYLAEKVRDFPYRVFETFGMTETISHIAMKRLNGNEAQGLFETTDPDIILGQDDRDCLVVIAPYITYQPVITNDIVELKDDRRFRWLGRVDNVVNSGGIKLFPEVLEQKAQAVMQHRFFFAGVPDVQLGQKMVLVVEAPTLSHTEVEMIRYLLQSVLTRYEMPREIRSIQRFEETDTHKVNRLATLAMLEIS